MIQPFLPAPVLPYGCPTCAHRVYGFHEHEILTQTDKILGHPTIVHVHYNHGSLARELWEIIRSPSFDWDRILHEIAQSPKESHEAPLTVQVHREEKSIWWKARRRRLTYDYVLRYEESITFHIYLSTVEDTPFEATHMMTSTL
jgi:hypothetical protein